VKLWLVYGTLIIFETKVVLCAILDGKVCLDRFSQGCPIFPLHILLSFIIANVRLVRVEEGEVAESWKRLHNEELYQILLG